MARLFGFVVDTIKNNKHGELMQLSLEHCVRKHQAKFTNRKLKLAVQQLQCVCSLIMCDPSTHASKHTHGTHVINDKSCS